MKKQRNVFRWVFLAVQILFVVWLIAGIAGSAHSVHNCQATQYLSAAGCRNATEAGAGVGVAIVIVLWLVVDGILAISRWVWVKSHQSNA